MARTGWLAALIVVLAPWPSPAQFGGMGGMGGGMGGGWQAQDARGLDRQVRDVQRSERDRQDPAPLRRDRLQPGALRDQAREDQVDPVRRDRAWRSMIVDADRGAQREGVGRHGFGRVGRRQDQRAELVEARDRSGDPHAGRPAAQGDVTFVARLDGPEASRRPSRPRPSSPRASPAGSVREEVLTAGPVGKDDEARGRPGRRPRASSRPHEGGGRFAGQNWSAETTSPPLSERMARKAARLTVLLMNRTEPSPKRALTPPEW